MDSWNLQHYTFGIWNIVMWYIWWQTPTWNQSLIMHVWAREPGQHMVFDVLLIAVKNYTWQKATEASNIPTSPDALSGWDSTCRRRRREHYTWRNIFWMICGCIGNIFGLCILLPGRVLNKIMLREEKEWKLTGRDTLNHGVIKVLFMGKAGKNYSISKIFRKVTASFYLMMP